MSKFLLFRNSTTSYVNSFENFRGAEVGSGTIKFYFKGLKGDEVTGNTDEVLVAVTSGMEYIALKDLLSLRERATKTLLVAVDHTNLKESVAHINALTSVAVAAQLNNLNDASTENLTSLNKYFKLSDDKKHFLMNATNNAQYYLPLASTLSAGWSIKITNVGNIGDSSNLDLYKATVDSDNILFRSNEARRVEGTRAKGIIYENTAATPDQRLFLEAIEPGTAGNSFTLVIYPGHTGDPTWSFTSTTSLTTITLNVEVNNNSNNTIAKIISAWNTFVTSGAADSHYVSNRVRLIVEGENTGAQKVTSGATVNFSGGLDIPAMLTSGDTVKGRIIYSGLHDDKGDTFEILYDGTNFIVKADVKTTEGISLA